MRKPGQGRGSVTRRAVSSRLAPTPGREPPTPSADVPAADSPGSHVVTPRGAVWQPLGPPRVVPFTSAPMARWSAVSWFSNLSCFGHEVKRSPFLKAPEGTQYPHTLVLGSSDTWSGFPDNTFLRAGGPGPLLPCWPPPGPSSKTVWTAILRMVQCGVKKQCAFP